MVKKLIVVLLVVIMSVSLFVGCGSSEKVDSGNDKTTNEETKADNNAKEENKEEGKPVDGGKITIYANGGSLSVAGNPSDPEYVKKMQKYVKEQTGIDVNYIIPPREAENEKLNMLLASGDEIDTFKGDIPTYVSKGVLMPIDELVEKYGPNLKKTWPEDWAGGWEGMRTPDGKTWGVPELPALAGYTAYMRTDWLEKYGIAMPKTTDELKQALITLKEKDPAGNGQTIPFLADMAGLNMAMSAGWMDIGYDWANRGFGDSDGKFKPMVFAPGYKEFIAEMADWYAKGLIYKESFTINKDRQMELIRNNRVAGSAIWYTTHTSPLQQLIQASGDFNIKIEVPDPLTGPKGLTRSMNDTYQRGWVVAKRSQNPEGVIKYMNWVQKDLETYLTVYIGMKGESWDFAEYNPDGITIIEDFRDPQNLKYRGEIMAGTSFAYTMKFKGKPKEGSAPAIDKLYINEYITNNNKCKLPSTFGFSFLMDKNKITEQVGSLEDIKKHIDQETTKFIMGARPMSEWEAFLKELDKVGLQKWIDAYTSEYTKVKK